MEEVFLTVKELADLKGCTERNIRLLIERGKLEAQQITGLATGKGGIQYRIPLSSLDNKLQLKFKRHLKAIEKQLKNVEEEKNPLPLDREKLTEEERQEIVFWKNLISEWQQFRSLKKNKAEADEIFIEMANLRNKNITLSRRALYRKDKAFKEFGEVGLLDKRGKHSSHARKLTDEVLDIFEYYFLHESRKSVPLCMTLTELALKHEGKESLLPLPSSTTFHRVVKEMPIPYIKFFRYNEKEFIGECSPYIKRMYEDLESNDIWVADNHTFDVMINKNNAPVRVYLTAFMDVRSRKMTGWCITDSP
ncbi:MAG: helix-turn-helix domain-containing protein, partial [Anaerotignaceae bacterium]